MHSPKIYGTWNFNSSYCIINSEHIVVSYILFIADLISESHCNSIQKLMFKLAINCFHVHIKLGINNLGNLNSFLASEVQQNECEVSNK